MSTPGASPPAGERRPPSVAIDDLAAPRFTEPVAEMLRAVEPMAAGLSFSLDAVLALARTETGLDDLGDDWFREPMGVVLGALDTEGGLSAFGRVSVHSQMVGHMRNRLRVEHLIGAHPEILDTPIAAPIVIVGQPRTGTTHLHNLVAEDPALRSLRYWESLEPVLSDDEQAAVAAGAPDPRFERCAVGLDFLNDAMPLFKRMHEMTVDHVHEEIQLLAIAGSTMLFETSAVLPSWREWYVGHDQTPAYEYLVRVLQCCQWLRDGDRPDPTRWVLKSPQHLEQIPVLLDVFPDATFVFTHRDPVSVIASNATMIAYTARFSTASPDPVKIGHYWADRIEEMLRAGMRDHALLPMDRTIDVAFDEFMADDLAMVERIYAVAGQPFDDEARAAMVDFLAAHPRGRHGGVRYDLAGDFDLDAAVLREQLRDYTDRFGVTLER
ncbi:MAG: sulfotransferase [Acidimicrobiia bacterium]